MIHPNRFLTEFYRLTGLSYQLVLADDGGIYRSEAVSGFWLRLAWLWPAEGEPDPVAALRALGMF